MWSPDIVNVTRVRLHSETGLYVAPFATPVRGGGAISDWLACPTPFPACCRLDVLHDIGTDVISRGA
jgi:hypothetical protein